MKIAHLDVQRFSLVSQREIDDILGKLGDVIGHPEMAAFRRALESAKTTSELKSVVNGAVGPSGLMEFARFDMGAILRIYDKKAPRCFRLLVGNPLIMRQMAEHVPDAAAYAPVTILIDERADGVHLSYDRMTSFLAPYGNAAAMNVAQELDAKIEKLLAEAAG